MTSLNLRSLSRFAATPACLVAVLLAGCDSPRGDAPVPTAPSLNAPRASSSPDGFTETPSGLKYKILKEGAGSKPSASNTVTVNYRGWLDDGTEFDSGKSTTFPLGRVIAGWTEGLQLVGAGGTIELEIPAKLGYGETGQGSIPPGATLHFEVELLKVL